MVEYVITKGFRLINSIGFTALCGTAAFIVVSSGSGPKDAFLLPVIVIVFCLVMMPLSYWLTGDVKVSADDIGITISDKRKTEHYDWKEFWTWYTLRQNNPLKGNWLLGKRRWKKLDLINYGWDTLLVEPPIDAGLRKSLEDLFAKHIGQESLVYPRIYSKDKDNQPMVG
jgi:hypothetical protein